MLSLPFVLKLPNVLLKKLTFLYHCFFWPIAFDGDKKIAEENEQHKLYWSLVTTQVSYMESKRSCYMMFV